MPASTCFVPACTDNFVTNKKFRFTKTKTFETGVFDKHMIQENLEKCFTLQ